MEEHTQSAREKKEAILQLMKLADHPLAKHVSAGIARVNPESKRGEQIISQTYENIDRHLSIIDPGDIHELHEIAAFWTPHRLMDAHTIVQEMQNGVLKEHREKIERIVRELGQKTVAIPNPYAASLLTETVLDLLHRARSDVEIRERLGKIADIFEKTHDGTAFGKTMYHIMHGYYSKLGPAIIDTVAESKDPTAVTGQLRFLAKVAKILENSEKRGNAPEEILSRRFTMKVESKDGYSALIEALNRSDMRSAFIRNIQRSRNRRRKR